MKTARAPFHLLLLELCFFAGVTALVGGIVLVWSPDGAVMHMPLSLLSRSPFPDFLVPGLFLASIVGVSNLIAGALVAREHPLANHTAFLSGASLTLWIVVQVHYLGPENVHWLQLAYFTVGLAISSLALLRERRLLTSSRT